MPFATTLKWNRARGFGLLAIDGAQEVDIFVHCSALQGGITLLHDGERVSFEYGKHPIPSKSKNSAA